MTDTLTTKIVKKAYHQMHCIRREYMMFTSAEGCLRVVIHSETLKEMAQEFWVEMRQRGLGVHEGYYIESQNIATDGTIQNDNRIFGIKVMTDDTVPPGEVELRAVLAKSWEPIDA